MADNYLSKEEFRDFVNELFTRLDEARDEDRQYYQEQLEEQIGKLPTREEYFKSQDELIKEVKTIREEHTIHAHQVSRNSRRLNKIETHLDLPSVD